MNKKILVVSVLTLVGLYMVAPTIIYFSMPKEVRIDQEKVKEAIPDWLPQDHVKLGLDLQGGVQLVLGVNTDGAIDNKLNRIGTEVARWALDNKLPLKTAFVVKGKQKLHIELEQGSDVGQFKEKFSSEYPGLRQVSREGDTLEYAYNDDQMKRIKQGALEQAERVIRTRVDKWGVSEPLINRRHDGSVLVQLPGFSNPEKAKELLGRTAQLQFKIVDDSFSGFSALAANPPEGITVDNTGSQAQFSGENLDQLVAYLKSSVPKDRELLFQREEIAGGKKARFTSYVVMAATELTGEDILDTGITQDSSSLDRSPAVSLRFTGPGGKRFGEVTGANVQKRMAIVLDDLVVSAPTIQGKITGGNAVINLGRGGYNQKLEEATELSLILKSGALPATIEVLEERQVGASLGPELAQRGIEAVLFGLALVLGFMILYYRRPGVIACIALVLNGVFLLALMAGFGFALTLPGIAGFILTLGMAVDANVLINERIRQELKSGKNAIKAVSVGFDKVFWTIIDANVTTLIAALVLLETNSSGPIRGFAITLIIGLVVSMFTSLYCTRLFFELKLARRSSEAAIRKWLGAGSSDVTNNINMDFVGFGKLASIIGVVAAIIIIGVGGTKGINWSVDFAGGTEMEVFFAKDITPKDIRLAGEKAGIKNLTPQSLEGSAKKYLLRFDRGDTDDQGQSVAMNLGETFKKELAEFHPDVQRVDFVGPQIGKELRTQGALSVLWALIGVFIYIGLRFDMRFAPGAIVKMVHDVFIILGFYIIFGRSFDLTSVAALLTVVGYSVNDTIVIYDRIRENIALHPKRLLKENINFSISETLSRTINTSLTTIMALIGVLIFGSAQIWNFAAAMAIGVIAATWSSTFIASSFVFWLEGWKKNKASKKIAAS